MYPELEKVKRYLDEYDMVPVFFEMACDDRTPIQIFQLLCEESKHCFMLESVNNGMQWGRYSFIGIQPTKEIRVQNGKVFLREDNQERIQETDDPMSYIQTLLEKHKAPPFPQYPKLTGGLVGYFSYDTIRYYEKKLRNVPKDDLEMPDINLLMYKEVIAFDHLSSKVIIIQQLDHHAIEEQYKMAQKRAKQLKHQIENGSIRREPRVEKSRCKITSNTTKEAYIEKVEVGKKYIREGDIFQVVPSQRYEIENPPDAFLVYRKLRRDNPSPYLYYFKHPDYEIAGASPEMLVNVTDGVVRTKPIAGTIQRGKTPEEDHQLEVQLLQDEKERAEHTMLVDLGRNDIGKVAEIGTVRVDNFMHIEHYSKVMHLVSEVQGKLREGKTGLDALVSVLPAGTLTGAPKIRAMEIIDQLETTKRGLYGGTVGYLSFDGTIDTCIAIRTALFKHNRAYVQAGGGVVLDSIGSNEYRESKNKALAVIQAIQSASDF